MGRGDHTSSHQRVRHTAANYDPITRAVGRPRDTAANLSGEEQLAERRRVERSLTASRALIEAALMLPCPEHDANRGAFCFRREVNAICGDRLNRGLHARPGPRPTRERAVSWVTTLVVDKNAPHYRHRNRIGAPR